MNHNTRTKIRVPPFSEITSEVNAIANCLELTLAAASTNWHYTQVLDAIAGGLRTLRNMEQSAPPPTAKDLKEIHAARERLGQINDMANKRRKLAIDYGWKKNGT